MSEFGWVAFALIVVVSSSRLTRLATYDEFPPVAWLREKFVRATDSTDRRRKWQVLAYCPYCASFWITAVVLGWGWFATEHGGAAETVWWLLNGALAGSYLAAILMVHDGEDED